MQFLSELWIPILVSGLIVWFASFVMHVVMPHHKGEWKRLADEGRFMDTVRGVEPGQYMFPWCDPAQMKDPAMQEKLKAGPSGTLTVFAGQVNMGRNLALTLLLYVVIGAFVAYLGSHTLEASDPYLTKFRVCGTAAFMAHGLGMVAHMIWFQLKGFWTYFFDNLVFALLTAGAFAGLWPA